MKRKCNSCDGIYNSYSINFANVCDNKCEHCIARHYNDINCMPDVDKIVETILVWMMCYSLVENHVCIWMN